MKKDTCGKRCWYADSSPSKCTCSCGGMNHGHGLIGEYMHDVQQIYPPCTPVRIIKGGLDWGYLFHQLTSTGKTVFKYGEICLQVRELKFPLPVGWFIPYERQGNHENGHVGNNDESENQD